MSLEQLKVNLEKFGQEHLIKFWDDLSADEKANLTSQIQGTDFESLYKILQDSNSLKLHSNENLKPLPTILKGSVENSSKEEIDRYESKGLKAIYDVQVAVVLLAGGQGNIKLNFIFSVNF